MEALVVGCGVNGLSTAVCLQEAGLSVHVWTATLPPETTSSIAAALWYPYKAYPENRVLGWGRHSFEVFEELAQSPETGVRTREGMELRREPGPEPWWQEAVPQIRRCTEDELPPSYHDGHVFTVPVVEMHRLGGRLGYNATPRDRGRYPTPLHSTGATLDGGRDPGAQGGSETGALGGQGGA